MIRIISLLLVLFLNGCSATASKHIVPKCDFSSYEQKLQESREYIKGDKRHESFISSAKTTALQLNNSISSDRGSISDLDEKYDEYKNLEDNLKFIASETHHIKSSISDGYCRPGRFSESFKYIEDLNEGVNYVLKRFPVYYEFIDESKTRLESEEREIVEAENKEREERSKATIRRMIYSNNINSRFTSDNFLIQLEDFYDGRLYISVKNKSTSKIGYLYPKKCVEYQNDLGGLSCRWETNAKLIDNFGNSYGFSISGISNSLQDLVNEGYSYTEPEISFYPGDKKYLEFKAQSVVDESTLTLIFTSLFFNNADPHSFKFPSKPSGSVDNSTIDRDALIYHIVDNQIEIIGDSKFWGKESFDNVIFNLNYNSNVKPNSIAIGRNHPNGTRFLAIFQDQAVHLPLQFPENFGGFHKYGDIEKDFYVQVTEHDFNNDDIPEIVIAVGNGLDSLAVNILKYDPPKSPERAKHTENWSLIGSFSGRKQAIVEGSSIWLPFGSQGLYTKYTLKDDRFNSGY